MRKTTFLAFLELAACIWRPHAKGSSIQNIGWQRDDVISHHAGALAVCTADDMNQDIIWITKAPYMLRTWSLTVPAENAEWVYRELDGFLRHSTQISCRSSSEYWQIDVYGYVLINGEKDENPKKMKHVSVAHDRTVWAVDVDDNIYHRVDDLWVKKDGKLKMLAVGRKDVVWGVNKDDKIFYRNFAESKWVQVAGRLKWLDVSRDGDLWGVNKDDQIFYWIPATGRWQKVSGSSKVIAVGDHYVAGINAHNILHTFNKDGMHRASGFEVDASNEQVVAAGSASLSILIVLAGVALLGCVFALLFCMRRNARKKRKKNECAPVKGNSDDEDAEADVDFEMEIEMKMNDNTTSAVPETLVESKQAS